MRERLSKPPPLVVIGGSTGAPAALREFLSAVALPLPACVLIAVHIRSPHDEAVAQRLGRMIETRLLEPGDKSKGTQAIAATPSGPKNNRVGLFHLTHDREPLKAGMIRMAPAGKHLRVDVGSQGEWLTSCREGAAIHGSCPAVDPLFESAAKVAGERVIAVVLTGMGRDGARGADAIRGQGGQVLVQDEASSVVWGMAGEVVGLGLAQAVLGPQELAREVEARVRVLQTPASRR